MNGSMGDTISHEPAPVPEAGLDVPPGVVWPTLPPLPGGGALPEKTTKETISPSQPESSFQKQRL